MSASEKSQGHTFKKCRHLLDRCPSLTDLPGFQVTLTRVTSVLLPVQTRVTCTSRVHQHSAPLRTVVDTDIQGRGEKLLQQWLLHPGVQQVDGQVQICNVCSLVTQICFVHTFIIKAHFVRFLQKVWG